MTKLCNSLCLVLAATVWSSPALAAPQWCSGSIEMTWLDNSGTVVVVGSWRNDHTLVCSTTQSWNGIAPAVCNAWFRLLLTAQVLKSQVIVYYPEAPACNALPTYGSSLAPGYVMLAN